MARMIPSHVPQHTESDAERVLFPAFAKQLSDDFVVLSGYRWVDENSPTHRSDADFVIIHPELGLLFVEAKSGSIRHHRSQWERRNLSTLEWEPIPKDPWAQSEDSMQSVIKFLTDRGVISRNQLRYYHAVAFPHSNRLVGSYPAGVRKESVLLRGDMGSIRKWVEQALDVAPRRPVRPELVKKIVDTLSPDFGIVETMSACAKKNEPTFARLTKQQHATYTRLVIERRPGELRRRALIRGEAGSGKTLLATAIARRLTRSDTTTKVLFLTFHLPLAEHLRRQLADDSQIDVFAFHEFSEHVVRSTGGVWPATASMSSQQQSEFFDFRSPELLEEALRKSPLRYSAIIVDEGQDFFDIWWPAIEEALVDPVNGTLYIFFDDKQDVHKHPYAFPIDDDQPTLAENLRSTQRICDFNDELGGVVGRPHELENYTPVGQKPKVLRAADQAEEVDHVRRLLHHFINEEQLESDQIIVLGQHHFDGTVYGQRPRLGNITLVNSEEPQGPGRVRYTTPGRFKGLEADCVIVVGFDDLHPLNDLMQARLYVCCSRARSFLTLVIRRPSTVLMQDIPHDVTESDVRRAFEEFGPIERLDYGPSSRRHGTNRAYVTMTSLRAAQRANINLNGALFSGPQGVRTNLVASPQARSMIKPLETRQRLYVGNLPDEVDRTDLVEHFSKIGPVLSASIPKGQRNRPRRYGFVSFCDPAHTTNAISEFDRSEWSGHTIRVFRAYGRLRERDGRNHDRQKKRPRQQPRIPRPYGVYVGNLPDKQPHARLDGLFSEFGDHDIRLSAGSAFVNFKSRAAATAAIAALNGKRVGGRRLVVKRSARGWPSDASQPDGKATSPSKPAAKGDEPRANAVAPLLDRH